MAGSRTGKKDLEFTHFPPLKTTLSSSQHTMPNQLRRYCTQRKWQNSPSHKAQSCSRPAACHITTKFSSWLLLIFSNLLSSGFSLTSCTSGCFLFQVSFQMLLLTRFFPATLHPLPELLHHSLLCFPPLFNSPSKLRFETCCKLH